MHVFVVVSLVQILETKVEPLSDVPLAFGKFGVDLYI